MNQKIILSVVVFIIFQYCQILNAQNSTLWLRNGKKVTVNKYLVDTANYYEGKINYTDLKGKNKIKYKDEVFSILDTKGAETILYTQNLELGEILTPEQMKEYVSGIGDARRAKISPMIAVGGALSGLAGAFVPQPEIKMGSNSMGLPVGVLVPTAYIAIIGATTPGESRLSSNYPVNSNTEHFLVGYQDGVRKKRIKNSIIGGGIGLITGFLIVTAIN